MACAGYGVGYMNPPEEKRAEPRAPIELRVDYEVLNMFFQDYTKNISKGGTFVRTEHPLPVGTEFVFLLHITRLDRTLELVGKVSWRVEPAEATEDKPAGMGIEFLYRSDEERERIDSLVRDMMRTELGERLAEQLLPPRRK